MRRHTPRLIRDEFEYPAVAALFLELVQLPACPPDDRVPPKDRCRGKLEEPDEVIAALDMDEFVGKNKLLGLVTQAGEQPRRQDDSPREPDRPDQGRQMTDRHPDVGRRRRPRRLENWAVIARMSGGAASHSRMRPAKRRIRTA